VNALYQRRETGSMVDRRGNVKDQNGMTRHTRNSKEKGRREEIS